MSSGSVGNAYLNVVPKVDGDARSLGNKFGNELSGGAKSALSAGAVALGNILSDMVENVAQGIAEQFMKSMQNIMDYEQLAGGAQKIFDEVDYSRIAKDAQRAFEDLNMSANEYLATINVAGATFAQTMGDEKGYEVAREGMLAISNYASGTGRNLSELNEKYQMITRSTSSYQSIADQFAGILPATSKDFLEQAKAAGYLSDEYQKLTDVPVAEYQEAVTKMLTKGVDELGLSANTLHESSETMSGSLAMLSKSWENFLTALGGGEDLDLDQITNDLIRSIGAVASNILPALMRVGQSIAIELPRIIGEALSNVAPVVRESLVNAFGPNAGKIFDQFVDMVENLKETVGKAIETISGLIEAAMPVIQEVVLPIVEIIVSGVLTKLNFLIQGIGAVLDFINANVVPVVRAVCDFLAQTIGPVVQDIADTVTDNMPEVEGVFEAATNGIRDVVQAVWPFVQTVIVNVMGAIQSIVSAVAPVVKNIISTAFEAIRAITNNVFPAIRNTITTVFNAIRSVASTVWGAIQSIVTGAVNAIRSVINGISSVIGSVQSTFNSIKYAITHPIETAQSIIGNIINTIKGWFSGFSVPIPHIPLPHPYISPAGWNLNDLLHGSIPSIGISWYAKGGILDGATLIGAGEAGPEMILPKNGGLMADFADAVTAKIDSAAVVNEIRELRNDLGSIIANSTYTTTMREQKRINQRVNAYV